ncbi:MAG: hypothetical protein H6739_21565 [Alphaproteobacteria bacterium]|nr:hypothetical protein [Alphaproteobacteria bacterium]
MDDAPGSADVSDYRYAWGAEAQTLQVRIEDDTLRDGLQGAYVRRPDLQERLDLLRLSVACGTDAIMLGFPGASATERAEGHRFIEVIEAEALDVTPRFLARPVPQDLEAIADLNQAAGVDVWADFFVCASPIRRRVEGWTLDGLVHAVRESSALLNARGVRFGVSLEDASRTPPADLAVILEAAQRGGARVVTVCDTVGACTPAAAARLVSFVRDHAEDVEVWWHGHDDRGLGLAAALAAAQAGADGISGAFLGLGERAGNTPLELVLLNLCLAGEARFNLRAAYDYCQALATATGTHIPPHTALVGAQAFATQAGTHGAAVLKARALGRGFEDEVFCAVPAALVGLPQRVVVGPASGRAIARDALQLAGLPTTPQHISAVLAEARRTRRWLETADLHRVCAQADAPPAPSTVG